MKATLLLVSIATLTACGDMYVNASGNTLIVEKPELEGKATPTPTPTATATVAPEEEISEKEEKVEGAEKVLARAVSADAPVEIAVEATPEPTATPEVVVTLAPTPDPTPTPEPYNPISSNCQARVDTPNHVYFFVQYRAYKIDHVNKRWVQFSYASDKAGIDQAVTQELANGTAKEDIKQAVAHKDGFYGNPADPIIFDCDYPGVTSSVFPWPFEGSSYTFEAIPQ